MTGPVDPAAYWARYSPDRVVHVRHVVLAELAALVNEAFPSDDVDFAAACERLLDLVQLRQLALVRGALPLPPDLRSEP